MTRTTYGVARAALLALVGVALALAGAGPASAHAGLKGSDPADGAVLTALPDRLTLTFTEAVLAGDDAVEVTGPDGDRFDVAVSTRRNRVLVDLGDADPVGGSFTVDWQVTSSDDHEISGDLGFEVALPPSPGPTATAGSPATAPAVPPTAAPPGTAAGAATGTVTGTAVDAVAGTAVVIGGLALLVLVAGSLLGAPRLRPLARPAWGVVAVAGLVLVPVLRLRATGRPLGDVTDLAVWFGGLLSWSGLVVVLIVALTGVLSARPHRGDVPAPARPA